jgi:hypothetical protein
MEKIGKNEALFRQVNEEIAVINDTFGAVTEVDAVVCECGDQSCIEQIHVDRADYERIRADSRNFLVIPGHEIPDVEHVVERTERYWVVRKDPGPPSELARELDDREH